MTSASRGGRQRENRDVPSLSEILYILQERWLMVAGVVLILAGAALLFGLFREPAYVAETMVSVEPQQRLDDEEAREAFMQDVQGAVSMQEAMREVRRQAGWEGEPAEFAGRLDPQFATRNGVSGLRVRFYGSTPEQAARAANAYAELFVQRTDKLDDERLAGGTLVADASVVGRATPPEESGSLPLIYAAAAAGAGLLLGGAAALLLEGRSSGWRDVRDAELSLRAPVLGTIPNYAASEGES